MKCVRPHASSGRGISSALNGSARGSREQEPFQNIEHPLTVFISLHHFRDARIMVSLENGSKMVRFNVAYGGGRVCVRVCKLNL